MPFSKFQASLEAMEDGGFSTDDYTTTDSDSITKGDLHWKVNINNDGSLRTRYIYFESDVIDLTNPSNHLDDSSSILRYDIYFLRLFYQITFQLSRVFLKFYYLLLETNYIIILLFYHFF